MGNNLKIFNRQNMAKYLFETHQAAEIAVFRGSGKANVEAKIPDIFEGTRNIVPITSENWVNTEGYHRLWNEFGQLQHRLQKAKNAAQPDTEAISELVQRLFIDITRRAATSGDLTSLVAEEITNFDFPEYVPLREFHKYTGRFQKISGANDSVPLIEQKYGATGTIQIELWANGWKDSLRNQLFNPIHSIQKVNDAIAEQYADLRNSLVLGEILRHTFKANNKVLADNTSGATRDEKMYNTVLKGVRKLRTLKDRQTNRTIKAPQITLLCNSIDSWDIQRVIRGQLDINGAAGTRGYNRQALPINSVIEYDGGNTDGDAWGLKTLDFPGVQLGKAYLFVPKMGAYVANKRPLTKEVGYGSVLELSTEEMAWYLAFGVNMDDFIGDKDGYGYVIEMTLPQM